MGLRISTNVASIDGQRSLGKAEGALQDSFDKLASGSRINKASDDAAGLAISEQLRAGIRSARQANRNANDGISMVQTAEGGLNEISNIISRLRELGIQTASDTIGDTERGMINKETMELKAEIQRIAKSTKWKSDNLLDGTSRRFDYQVGINNNSSEDRISYDSTQTISTIDALGLDSLDFSQKQGGLDALKKLDTALTRVSSSRANLGALQNRLTSTATNLGIVEENLSSTNSRIRDTDVANATAEMTRNNILLQAGTSSLAQANQTPQVALKLLT